MSIVAKVTITTSKFGSPERCVTTGRKQVAPDGTVVCTFASPPTDCQKELARQVLDGAVAKVVTEGDFFVEVQAEGKSPAKLMKCPHATRTNPVR